MYIYIYNLSNLACVCITLDAGPHRDTANYNWNVLPVQSELGPGKLCQAPQLFAIICIILLLGAGMCNLGPDATASSPLWTSLDHNWTAIQLSRRALQALPP